MCVKKEKERWKFGGGEREREEEKEEEEEEEEREREINSTLLFVNANISCLYKTTVQAINICLCHCQTLA